MTAKLVETKLKNPLNQITSICLYCASSDKIPDKYFHVARQLGKLMGWHGLTLVNGAGCMGLMQAASDACHEAGGRTIGVIPSFMIKEGWCHDEMDEIIETADMHTRQEKMAELSDAAIVLPGGFGTLAEFSELVTWKQLGLYLKPIVLLNTDGYYDKLVEFLNVGMYENFLRQKHMETFVIANTPEEAIDLALSTPMWDKTMRRFAKI